MNYLVDTSALVRLVRQEVDPAWHELEDCGLLSVCEPVLAETLSTVDTRSYVEAEQALRDLYIPVTVPDGVWELCEAIRLRLAPHSAHRGVSVADLVVAATAVRLKLTVLHEDADYETISRFVPELKQHRISAGVN